MKHKLLYPTLLIAWIFAMAFVLQSCSKDYPEPEVAATLETEHNIATEASHAAQNKLLAQLRRATAKYHRIEVAEADKYMLDTHCAARPGVGAMGYHAINFGLVDDVVDPLMPEVLVYERQKNGHLQLVAIEYIVVAGPWDAQHSNPPMLGTKVFDDHRDFLKMGGPQFPHYQLHVWIWKNNPTGIYTPFNPKVSCDN
jgi:hypothetical protein